MLRTGTMITCPKCNTAIATTTKKLDSGDWLTYDCFQFFDGQGFDEHNKMKCLKCGTPWFHAEKHGLHTREGWRV